MKILVIGDFHGKFPKKFFKEVDNVDLVVALGDYAGIDEWRPYLLYCSKFYSKGLKPKKSLKEFLGEKKYKEIFKKDDLAGRYVLNILSELKKHVFYVFGNADDRFYKYPFENFFDVTGANSRFIKGLKNIKNITYGKVSLKNISFFGFGGYVDVDSYLENKDAEYRKSEKYRLILSRYNKSKKRFFSMLASPGKKDIFVFHYPPKGYFDIIKAGKTNHMNGKSAGIGFFTEAIKKYKPKLVLCGHMHEYQGIKKMGKSYILNPGCAAEGKFAIVNTDNMNVDFFR